ncbi:hypothetical protein JQ557_10265 [Bradyrhizobium sp. U87765 SZCCT0131]|uniref:hypothetical protein n=1 Tax=unclassified Bradyrhizobium TaxID=2631580 RepID=UPI001BA5D494|nr:MULTISPECIES: hypothetical protein [unclassified Bradyrhizobium]MBR1218374.1 hypothetical protein [Bradyrhizobium sp. U87765 SZCCT0131]MBR1260680.1 hypothetical protein [Bradyrhizobium sp. U87765 SZCCT0134]MBR1303872.1 hypothetical protein [Bradyrhizobium sp. U87765 SZCCT0110]MBR1319478.1 hypothetical protein [Bradyrhizobium sp. U87765 SZCCT0109]MBR1347803.1 hypothetical protein [Bradyrhizobium sp. U87765 SZCCT0048]
MPLSDRSRFFISSFVFIIFLLLAAGSAEESSQDKKSRILKTEGISETVYDTRVRDFGSYDDYMRATDKGMNATQYAKYKSQREACGTNWYSCSDNEQLVNNWSGWSTVQADCKLSANDRAKYGDPEWPWLAFSTFLKGSDYVKTGKAVAIEPNAKFKNGFNASVRVKVICLYDLKNRRVENITISER